MTWRRSKLTESERIAWSATLQALADAGAIDSLTSKIHAFPASVDLDVQRNVAVRILHGIERNMTRSLDLSFEIKVSPPGLDKIRELARKECGLSSESARKLRRRLEMEERKAAPE